MLASSLMVDGYGRRSQRKLNFAHAFAMERTLRLRLTLKVPMPGSKAIHTTFTEVAMRNILRSIVDSLFFVHAATGCGITSAV